MTACAHLSDKGTPCGRPAVAVWWSPVQGRWPLCEMHDGIAKRYAGPDHRTWTRQEAPQTLPDGPSAPVAA